MKRVIFLLTIVFLWVGPVYALTMLAGVGEAHPDGDAGAANARWVRASGSSEITSDIGYFTDFYVSRDNGATWYTLFENTTKTINWVGASGSSVIGSVKIPAGTYNLSKNKQSQEVLTVSLNDGTNATRPVTVTLRGDTDFIQDAINLTVERDGAGSLRLDDPIIQVDVLIRWNAGSDTYDVLNYTNDISKADQTGARVIVD